MLGELHREQLDERVQATSQQREARRLAFELGTDRDEGIDRRLVGDVLRGKDRQGVGDFRVPVRSRQAGRNRCVLVGDVQRQRDREVATELGSDLADLECCHDGPVFDEAATQDEVLADAAMTGREQIDEVVRLSASPECDEHMQPEACTRRTGTIRALARVMLAETPVATLVLDHSEYASVFDRYRIDYCCKGDRTLRSACEERGIDLERVLADCALARQRRTPTAHVDLRTLPTKALIVEVIAHHHQYLHRTLPFLQTLAKKVGRVHGERQPALRELSKLVDRLATTLLAHLDDEERHLFPALLTNDIGVAAPLLSAMRVEHEEVGAMLAEIRTLTADFTPADWACNSYRTLFTELAHLEADTLRHVHVENHVLLPRSLEAA